MQIGRTNRFECSFNNFTQALFESTGSYCVSEGVNSPRGATRPCASCAGVLRFDSVESNMYRC